MYLVCTTINNNNITTTTTITLQELLNDKYISYISSQAYHFLRIYTYIIITTATSCAYSYIVNQYTS